MRTEASTSAHDFGSRDHGPWRRRAPWLLLILSCGVLAALWIWEAGETSRMIGALPVEERRDIYARAMANFQALCPASGPARTCEGQAEFLLSFPECDEACQQLVEPWSHEPTR